MTCFYLKKSLNFSNTPLTHLYNFVIGFNSFSEEFIDDLKTEKNEYISDLNKVLDAVINCLDCCDDSSVYRKSIRVIAHEPDYTYEYMTKFNSNCKNHIKKCFKVAKLIKRDLDLKLSEQRKNDCSYFL